MAKSPPALVEPALLVWGREMARLAIGEVAARLKLPEGRVLAWESGSQRPSVAQLRKLAEVYRRPVAVFFLPEPPRGFDALRDFRRVPGEEPKLSDSLQADLLRAQELRDAALSLLDEGDEVTQFPVSASIGEEAERVADRLRSALGVSPETQLSWSDSYEALREWRLAVEGVGVLVVNMARVDVADARGFSVAEFPLPLIALNAKDSPNGRQFTLMHELAHLALHDGGICDWTNERRLAGANRRIETFCNQVAAAVLMPSELVLAVTRESRLPAPDAWPDETLRRQARALSVSEEALLRRFVQLGLATPDFYASKRADYLKRYAEAAAKGGKPVVSFEKRVVGRLGTAYLDLAFGAYYAHRLTLSELSSYTGVRIAHLARVEREAFGMSRVPGGAA